MTRRQRPGVGHDDEPPADRSVSRHALSDEDLELWRHVSKGVSPLAPAKRVASPRQPPPREPSRTQVAPVPAARAAANDPPIRAEPRASPPHRPATSPSLAAFDRRKARRLGSGRTDIEARLDLHGLTQDVAHARLAAFLRDCRHQGMKMVMVITGKGGDAAAERSSLASWDGASHRGVLRRNLPRWLEEPELRALIVGYTSAAHRHGGSGAFYIELRRPRP